MAAVTGRAWGGATAAARDVSVRRTGARGAAPVGCHGAVLGRLGQGCMAEGRTPRKNKAIRIR